MWVLYAYKEENPRALGNTCWCDLFAGFSDVTLLELRSRGDGSLVTRIEARPTIVECPIRAGLSPSPRDEAWWN